MLKSGVSVVCLLCAASAFADDGRKTEAAVGGGVGGAVGAVIGEELGDREGAIIGSAIGAAIGTAVTTRKDPAAKAAPPEAAVDVNVSVTAAQRGHPKARHCPPGQAKKGRC